MKYSIIIPVYNAETYLPACIRSILTQSVQDYEVILVNDGSTDKSEAICRDYARRDARFRLISQENSGSLAARTAGIVAARGEYLLFLDADDQWLAETLSSIDGLLTENKPDVLAFFFRRFDCPEEKAQLAAPIPGTVFYGKSQFREYAAIWLQNTALNAMWMKAVRRACLRWPEESAPQICFGDDLVQTAWVLHCANSLLTTDRVLYRYRVTPGSILGHFQPCYVGELARAYGAVYRFLQDDFPGDTALEQVFFQVYTREICNMALRLFRWADNADIQKWTKFLGTDALFCSVTVQSFPKTPSQHLTLWLIRRNCPGLSRLAEGLVAAARNGKRQRRG